VARRRSRSGASWPNSGFIEAHAVATDSSLAAAGTGGVTRQEQISLTVAAVVTQVLPNGNLVIQGQRVTDLKVLAEMNIPSHEDVVEVDKAAIEAFLSKG